MSARHQEAAEKLLPPGGTGGTTAGPSAPSRCQGLRVCLVGARGTKLSLLSPGSHQFPCPLLCPQHRAEPRGITMNPRPSARVRLSSMHAHLPGTQLQKPGVSQAWISIFLLNQNNEPIVCFKCIRRSQRLREIVL